MRFVLSDKKKTLFWFIVFKIVLDLTYAFIQADVYGYYGFDFKPDLLRWLLSWGLYLVVGGFILCKKTNCSTIFVYTIYMLSLAPCFVYYEYNCEVEFWMLLVQALALMLMHIVMNKLAPIVKIKNKKIPYNSKKLTFFIAAVVGVYFVYTFMQYGIPVFSSLSWENISIIRANSNISTLMAVIQNLLCRIVCPIVLMLLFKKKKWGLFVLVLMVPLYTYSVTGFKTYLFISLVLIAVLILPKINLKRLITYALPGVSVLCSILYVGFGQIYPYALINERVLFLPAKIKFAYFDYFSQHEFIYFSQNTIAKILGVESNYSQNIPNLIGEIYFNKPEMWTNTGFMADAYANLGVFGIILVSIFMAVVISWVDMTIECESRDVHLGIQAMFLLYYISLNDGSAISIFFSGGMLFAVLLVMFISFNDTPRKRYEVIKNGRENEN